MPTTVKHLCTPTYTHICKTPRFFGARLLPSWAIRLRRCAIALPGNTRSWRGYVLTALRAYAALFFAPPSYCIIFVDFIQPFHKLLFFQSPRRQFNSCSAKIQSLCDPCMRVPGLSNKNSRAQIAPTGELHDNWHYFFTFRVLSGFCFACSSSGDPENIKSVLCFGTIHDEG